jgi:c-di-GMP-binding flagellar brake protein YcgR
LNLNENLNTEEVEDRREYQLVPTINDPGKIASKKVQRQQTVTSSLNYVHPAH